jgi:hypothetical protein
VLINVVHAFSTSSGHQVAEERTNRSLYLQHRGKKLDVQTKDDIEPEQPQILVNVKCYINGFLANTTGPLLLFSLSDHFYHTYNATDIEMKRIIASAGGKVLYVLHMFIHFPR